MIKVCRVPLQAALVLAATSVASIMFSLPVLQSARNPTTLDANNQPARILSAFFGLDNALPRGANILCPGAARQDRMPVLLSHTVDPDTLQPEDFRVFTRSGSERTPHCLTLRPASYTGERRHLQDNDLAHADDRCRFAAQNRQ